MSLPEEHLHDFHAQPWAAALFSTASLKPVPTPARLVAQPDALNAHSFFSGTLAKPAALRAVQSFNTRKDPRHNDLLMLFSLGTGLNGPGGIVHGGLVMALLDSTMAFRAYTYMEKTGIAVFTAGFEAEFKRKVVGPCVLLAKGRVVAEEENGKVLRLQSELVDGHGTLYMAAKAKFVVKEIKRTQKAEKL